MENEVRANRIAELIDGTMAADDTELSELQTDPKPFLVVEYDDDDYALYAEGADTLNEAAQIIDKSDTRRSGVIVHDLDTGIEWNPIMETVSFASFVNGHMQSVVVTKSDAPPIITYRVHITAESSYHLFDDQQPMTASIGKAAAAYERYDHAVLEELHDGEYDRPLFQS